MYNTPYYLSGNQKHRYHQHKASKAIKKAGVAGVGAGLLLHPKTSQAAGDFVAGSMNAQFGTKMHFDRNHTRTGGIFLAGAAGAMAAHSGVHVAKANKLKKEYYYRQQGGHAVRVKKGKRK